LRHGKNPLAVLASRLSSGQRFGQGVMLATTGTLKRNAHEVISTEEGKIAVTDLIQAGFDQGKQWWQVGCVVSSTSSGG
jgi:hypothetical protein